MAGIYLRNALMAGCFLTCFLQCADQPASPDNEHNLYPTGNKYSTVLYAEDTHARDTAIKLVASHAVITRPGYLEWEKLISEEGDYEAILGYSAWNNSATVTLTAGGAAVGDVLEQTRGVFDTNTEWYNMNYERRLLKGRLHLEKGVNRFRVEIDGIDDSTSLTIYALELMPVDKKKVAAEDIDRAIAARPAMDWFTGLQYGAMFHWTAQSAPRTGPIRPYKEAVKDFDVAKFVDMVARTGAQYIIFTGNHADPHFPGPLEAWEKEYPGQTTERDLITEIADGLKEKNIHFILYLATHIYAQQNKVDDAEFTRLNHDLITAIGDRYKDKIEGFWLDGFYQSYRTHPSFDFEAFYKAAKTGNPSRLLSLNSWLYPVVSQWQDYWAGEVYTPSTIPESINIRTGPGKGLNFQSLVVLENDWVHGTVDKQIPAPRLGTEQLINYISSCSGKGPVTINIGIYQDGTIGEEALAEMEKIKAAIIK